MLHLTSQNLPEGETSDSISNQDQHLAPRLRRGWGGQKQQNLNYDII